MSIIVIIATTIAGAIPKIISTKPKMTVVTIAFINHNSKNKTVVLTAKTLMIIAIIILT